MKHTTAPAKRTLLIAFLSVVLAVGLTLPVSIASAVPTSEEKKAEAQAVLEKLDGMQVKLDEASNNYSEAEAARAEAEKKVAEAQQRIEQETEKMKGLQHELGVRARSMYRTGGNTFLDVILSASTFEEFAVNWNILETLNEKDAELVVKTKEARVALEAVKVELEQQEAVAAEKAQAAKEIKESAEATVAEMQATYESLSAEAQELMEQEEAARSAAAAAAAQAAINANKGSSSEANNSKVQTVTGNTVVDRAYSQLGKPYVWGAAGSESFDCSGLVGYALTGRMGSHWCTTGTIMGWTRVSDPQPGDIAINDHHTGIYIGGGQMIHAPRRGDVVKVSGVHSDMWYVRY